MDKRRLGKTGYEVAEIGLGCWQLGEAFGALDDTKAAEILALARELGVNFWDTADVYGAGQSERRIAPELKKAPGTFVATKVGRDGALYPDKYTKQTVKQSLEGSAQRLGVDTIDLAQLHCVPPAVLEDGAIFNWLEDLQQEGLIRHFGASVETVDEGLLCLKHPKLASLQIIFNLFRQDAAQRLLPEAEKADVGIIVRLPLASGLLSGKYGKDTRFEANDHRNFNRDGAAFSVGETFSGIPFETGVDLVSALDKLNTTGWPLSHLAIRWILDHPAVSTIIAGVTKPHQLRENVEAAGRAPLDPGLMAELSAFYTTKVRPTVRGQI